MGTARPRRHKPGRHSGVARCRPVFQPGGGLKAGFSPRTRVTFRAGWIAAGFFGPEDVIPCSLQHRPLQTQVLVYGGNADVAVKRHKERPILSRWSLDPLCKLYQVVKTALMHSTDQGRDGPQTQSAMR
jgi:hypothetical protein